MHAAAALLEAAYIVLALVHTADTGMSRYAALGSLGRGE